MESIDDIVDRIRRSTDFGARGAIHDAVRALEGLVERFQKTRSPQDANQILEFTAHILSVVPEEHESRITFLGALYERFSIMGPGRNPEDMDRSVRLAENVFSVALPGAGQRIFVLSNLNTMLRHWYIRTGDVQCIKRAITVAEEAIEVIHEDSPSKAMFLDKLAISLAMLFEHTHDLKVAERALATAESALRTAEMRGDVKEVAFVSNTLARILGRRFEQTGMIADLDRALGVLSETVPQIPEDNREYILGLSYMATLLGMRFEQQGDVADLDASIRYMETVLRLMPDDDPDRPVQLYNQANRLAERAQYTGAVCDLDSAIDYGHRTLLLATEDHPERANWLGGLSRFYGMRFTMGSPATRNDSDLSEGINLSRQAVKAVGSNDILTRAVLVSVLSNLLWEQYTQDGEVAKLDEAIDVLRGTLQPEAGLPTTHPGRGALEHALGRVLRERSRLGHNATDLEESGEAYRRAWACRNAPLTIRIDGAIRAGEIAASRAEHLRRQDPLYDKYWTEASTYFDHAVGLLHVLSPRHMQNVNKQYMLKRFAGLGAHAAAAALNAKKGDSYALQQLELGRGIISGLTLDLRTDLSSLREKRPDWADQFSRLRDMLDSGHNSLPLTGSWELGGQARRRAEKEFEDLVTQIRGRKALRDS
ncbi:hypothetical protein B0I37DRAFT_217353 [Chaetomium sp. MPI-CAGE-AT-0009]|nr:hypothetical protein B0I37DRAFT_217353 [Chaetomium sp. MPI-CAGE-AT-0009]